MTSEQHPVVARLLSVFGEETVLLPVPRGEKGCRVKEWPNTTWEHMNDSGYLEKLEEGNVGVLCGGYWVPQEFYLTSICGGYLCCFFQHLC